MRHLTGQSGVDGEDDELGQIVAERLHALVKDLVEGVGGGVGVGVGFGVGVRVGVGLG